MKNTNFREILSALCVVAILAGFTRITAGPVRFDQVIPVVNSQPIRGEIGSLTRLKLTDAGRVAGADDDDGKKKSTPVQDGRVITETRTDIVLDDVCDCEEVLVARRGFPAWALLGLAAIPIAFIIIKRKKNTPTPTLPPPPTTQTPTPSMTPTPTPHMTPSPTPPEPVPEPMTILLFGTGLASIGLAARRRFGKKSGEVDEEGETEE